jgi:1-acyl-sn-glycerol-3-phosphate acyltransferase
MFATIKLLLTYVVLGVPAGIIFIPYALIRNTITPLYRSAMWIVGIGVKAAGIKVEVLGVENIPAERQCIYMSNHVSNLDPPVLLPALPGQCAVLLKKELMNIPILGTAMRIGKFVPVGRAGSRSEAAASVTAAGEAIKAGMNILVFAEGTRSADGRLSSFKKGPFFLAQQTGAPIVPIAVSGTYEMMPKSTLKTRPGTAIVRILAPIDPKDFKSREDLMQAVHEAIANALPPEMKPLPVI